MEILNLFIFSFMKQQLNTFQIYVSQRKWITNWNYLVASSRSRIAFLTLSWNSSEFDPSSVVSSSVWRERPFEKRADKVSSDVSPSLEAILTLSLITIGLKYYLKINQCNFIFTIFQYWRWMLIVWSHKIKHKSLFKWIIKFCRKNTLSFLIYRVIHESNTELFSICNFFRHLLKGTVCSF